MAPRRAPDDRGPFLGTEQIIRRLREVRKPVWRFDLKRGALTAVCASAVFVAALVVFDRATQRRLPHPPSLAARNGREVRVDSRIDNDSPPLAATYDAPAARKPQRRVPLHKARAAEAESEPAERATDEGEPEASAEAEPSATSAGAASLTGWDLDESRETAPPPARRAKPAPPPAPVLSADDPTTNAALRVEVRGGPGTIFVDGKRVALDRNWETSLAHGEHHLMVRVGGRSMTYKLRLRGEGVKIIFDDAHSRIREEPWVPRAALP